MNKRKYLEILLFTALCTRVVLSQGNGNSCSEDSIAGPDSPARFNKDFDKDKGFGYVVYGDLYTIKCCGTLRKWEFSVGDNGNIELQIWRPDDKRNKQFKLVGLNRYSVSRKEKNNPGYVTFELDGKDLLPVEENDVIGWYAPGDSLVEYTDGTDYVGIWKLLHDDKVKVGDTVDFSSGDKQSSRTYGIQATIAPNKPPSFDLLLATSISMNADIGTTVYVVHVMDEDTQDVSDLKIEMLTQNEFFAFDPLTGVLSVSSEITVPDGGDSVTFDFKVTDRCGAESTGSLTVHIDYEPSRPTFPPRTDSNPVTDLKTSPETTTAKTTQKTTKDVQTTKDDKLTEEKTSFTKTVATTVPDNLPDNQTTSASDSITDTNTVNETLSAMDTGPSIDAALVGGIVAGIVGLIIITVVSLVCIANKKGKVKPSSKDPEKANNTKKENNQENISTEKQLTTNEKAKDTKTVVNGKLHVKDKG